MIWRVQFSTDVSSQFRFFSVCFSGLTWLPAHCISMKRHYNIMKRPTYWANTSVNSGNRYLNRKEEIFVLQNMYMSTINYSQNQSKEVLAAWGMSPRCLHFRHFLGLPPIVFANKKQTETDDIYPISTRKDKNFYGFQKQWKYPWSWIRLATEFR